MPPFAIEDDQSLALEGLLCATDMVLPFFPEVYPINYAINGVVAKIGMNLLDEGMKPRVVSYYCVADIKPAL